MAKKLFYKIGEACKKVDVQPYVLRYWETEFELLSPGKSKSGQRVYTDDDLAIIRRIKELLYDEGYTTVGAKKKLQSELAEGVIGSSSGKAPAGKPSKTKDSETASSEKAGSEKAGSKEAESKKAESKKAGSKKAQSKKAESKTAESIEIPAQEAASEQAAPEESESDQASSTVPSKEVPSKEVPSEGAPSKKTQPKKTDEAKPKNEAEGDSQTDDSGRLEELETGLRSALDQARQILEQLG